MHAHKRIVPSAIYAWRNEARHDSANSYLLRIVCSFDHLQPTSRRVAPSPYYINDYNKYFVIVGTAPTREEGVSAMKRLKEKAPQFDFVLYEPYGTNKNYGIMMASWVPREVASEALRLAQRFVAPDAFVWACRSTGDSC